MSTSPPSPDGNTPPQPGPIHTDEIQPGQDDQALENYITKLIEEALASGEEPGQIAARLKQEMPSGWEAQAWAREVDYSALPLLGPLLEKDRERAKARALVAELIQKRNDPDASRERVRLGSGCDLHWYKNCMQEAKIHEVRISETICILKSPATAKLYIDEAIGIRRALYLARHLPQTASGDNESYFYRVETPPPPSPVQQLEDALRKVLKVVQSQDKQPGPWAARVGWYRVSFEPDTTS